MNKVRRPNPDRQPVADIVHDILESARFARAEGPSSALYSRDAQVSGALTQAGTLLAKLDRSAPPKPASVLQNLWHAPAAQKSWRHSWFRGSPRKTRSMPDAKQIERLLRASVKDGRRLVLDRDLVDSRIASNSDIDCTLSEGAVDPVCVRRTGG